MNVTLISNHFYSLDQKSLKHEEVDVPYIEEEKKEVTKLSNSSLGQRNET